jgi:hypothetical protein
MLRWGELFRKALNHILRHLIIYSIITSSIFAGLWILFVHNPNVPCPNLTPEEAKFETQNNVNFMLFWAVLFFTCIIGIIELIPSLKVDEIRIVERNCLVLFYIILLGGIEFSVPRIWNLYRENFQITFCGKLGQNILEWVQSTPGTLDNILLNPLFEWICLSFVTIVLVLLLFSKLHIVD